MAKGGERGWVGVKSKTEKTREFQRVNEIRNQHSIAKKKW
jgi:hypothetical protein